MERVGNEGVITVQVRPATAPGLSSYLRRCTLSREGQARAVVLVVGGVSQILPQVYHCCRCFFSPFLAGALSFCDEPFSDGFGRQLWVAAQCGVKGSGVAAQGLCETLSQLLPLMGYGALVLRPCRTRLNTLFCVVACFFFFFCRRVHVQMKGRQDVGERDRGGGGYEVRPRIHLTLLRDGLEDADVRNGKPHHPHRREEGRLPFRCQRQRECAEQTSAAHSSLPTFEESLVAPLFVWSAVGVDPVLLRPV